MVGQSPNNFWLIMILINLGLANNISGSPILVLNTSNRYPDIYYILYTSTSKVEVNTKKAVDVNGYRSTRLA